MLETLRKQARSSAWNILACSDTIGGHLISAIQNMRGMGKKPSIRQTLAEKKVEAAACSASAPEKEHKSQKASL